MKTTTMKSSISTLAIILTLVILSSYSCKKEELENEDGNEIAEFNYAWRQVDEMCGELKTARQSIASRIIFGDNLRLTNMDLESYSEVMNLSRTTTLFA